MKYNWQQQDWPNFSWDTSGLEPTLLEFSEITGRVDGMLAGLPDALQVDTLISILVEEAVKTSEIEGAFVSRPDVYSSIRRCLGIDKENIIIKDLQARGISETTIDARKNFLLPLTQQQLFLWHDLLFSHGKTNQRILVGTWRTHSEPMQIISGVIGKEKIHFEAPPSNKVPHEMEKFVNWFNSSGPKQQKPINIPLIRSAIAHLYFESIHPFEDGNGRIGRIIAEKALSQGLGRPVLLSLSRTIENNKANYYDALKKAQRSNCVTDFIFYFAEIALQSQKDAMNDVKFILEETRFLDKFRHILNDRQTKVILKMFSSGPSGFIGGMSAKKYMGLTGASKATATRDLIELLRIGAFRQIASGRSTHYELLLKKD